MRLVPGAALVRRRAASALDGYGRAVVTVAGRIAPRPADSAQTSQRLVDARTADMTVLRRLALDSTIAAADDPGREAYDRLVASTDHLSEWAAGRLLSEAERMRQAAVAALSAGSGDGKPLPRRQFDAVLRRQFPWLDEDSAGRLYDHAMLVAHRIVAAAQAEPAARPAAPVRAVTGVLARLRHRR